MGYGRGGGGGGGGGGEAMIKLEQLDWGTTYVCVWGGAGDAVDAHFKILLDVSF